MSRYALRELALNAHTYVCVRTHNTLLIYLHMLAQHTTIADYTAMYLYLQLHATSLSCALTHPLVSGVLLLARCKDAETGLSVIGPEKVTTLTASMEKSACVNPEI